MRMNPDREMDIVSDVLKISNIRVFCTLKSLFKVPYFLSIEDIPLAPFKGGICVVCHLSVTHAGWIQLA